MAKLPVFGGFNAYKDEKSGSERSVNQFAQKHQGKDDWRMRATPGLRPFVDTGGAACRGGIGAEGRAFFVCGNGFYEILENATSILRGTLAARSNRVVMDYNGFEIILTDGASGYVFKMSNNTFSTIASADFYPSKTVAVVDGYAVLARDRTGQFFHSDLYDALTYIPSDFASATSNPDPLIAMANDPVGLIGLGTRSVEIYWNTGDSQQVFQRRGEAKINIGCVAPYSVVSSLMNSTIWLGSEPEGEGGVYRLAGGIPERVTGTAMDEALNGFTLNNATAWGYKQAGHTFYCLNVPGIDTTFVLDLTTQMWHERRSFRSDGSWGRWWAEGHVAAFGKHFVGDYRNGNIYQLDLDYYFDGEDTLIRRERTIAPIFDEDWYDYVEFEGIKLDMLTGVGLTNPPYDDPHVILQVSRDGGKTFGSERSRPVGKIGERETTVHFRRLSVRKESVFRIVYTYPTPYALLGAAIRARK